MLIVLLLGIICVFTAYLSRFKESQWGLKLSFILIFLFLGLRYNYGNDYKTYYLMFSAISKESLTDLFNPLPLYEPGWVIINWLFKGMGFFSMNIFIAAISCIIYYNFIVTFLDKKYYWLAVFIYIFYPGFMLLHSTAMRQSLSIMLFVYSYKFIVDRKFTKYFLTSVLAISFHYTAVILIPIYLIVFFKKRVNLLLGGILFFIYTYLLFFGSNIAPYMKLLINNFYEKYDAYSDPSAVSSGLGFIYYTFLFVLILYFERFQINSISRLFKISIVGFFFIPLPLIIDMTGRMLMYFTPATIVTYPILAKTIISPYSRLAFITFFILISLFQFIQFMYSDIYNPYFFEYNTIFSAPVWQ
jgi:hypothetical protein